MSSTTPHDALFKEVFSEVEHAAPVLRAALRPELASAIDWSTLSLTPGSFVDPDLVQQHTDLLFSARTASARPVLLYALFEHQSTADPIMPFRLLKYMVRIWDRHLREHPGGRRFPAIVPVVVHHSESGWTSDTRFEALLDLDQALDAAAGDHVVRFRFALDDISHLSDDAIRARAITQLAKLALGCLRHGRNIRRIVTDISRWASTLRDVYAAPNGPRAVSLILRYMFTTGADLSVEEVHKALAGAVDPRIEEEIVTLAERLMAEGEERGVLKGRREGRLEGQRELLIRLVTQRFGELPEAAAERVRGAQARQIEVWVGRVLTAASLEAVLAAD